MTDSHSRLDIDLTIRLTEAPGAPEYVFRLTASGGALAEGCTLPDSPAALEAVSRHGEDIFFPKPGPPKLCTQQYGGPQVAVVTGWYLTAGKSTASSAAPTAVRSPAGAPWRRCWAEVAGSTGAVVGRAPGLNGNGRR